MEEIIQGLVISSKDLKDKDKLITVFSAEKGLVNLALKGVKNANAKLKFAKEIFNFGKYFLASKGTDFYICTGCDGIESFYNLSQDINKYMEACSILKALKSIAQYGEQDIKLFLETINALKTICYDNVKENIVLCKYLISLFEDMGYKLSLSKCAMCGQDFYGKRFLILDTGEVVCAGCKIMNSLEITSTVHTNLRFLNNTDYEKLNTLNLKEIDETLNLLISNFKFRFGVNIKLYE